MREVGVGGYQAQRDLRGWAPQRGAQGKAAMIGYRDQTGFHLHHMLDIRTVDPNVAGTEPVRGPAGDHGDRRGSAMGSRGTLFA